MSGLTKAFIVVMLILSAMVAVGSASLFAQRTNWYEKYKAEKDKVVDAEKRAADAVAEKDAKVADAEQNLKGERDLHKLTQGARDQYKGEADSLKTELIKEKAFSQQLNDTVEQLTRTTEDLQTSRNLLEEKLAEVINLKDGALKEKMEAIEDAVQLEKLVQNQEAQIRAFERRIAQLTTGPDTDEAAPTHKIEGTITNMTQGGHLAISVGTDDHVDVGNEFTVFRGATYVGRLRVVRTGRDVSVAKEMPEWRNEMETIQVGDSVSNAIR